MKSPCTVAAWVLYKCYAVLIKGLELDQPMQIKKMIKKIISSKYAVSSS